MPGTRYKVADEAELAEEGSRVIEEVEGVEIAVFRIDDDYHAVANFCPHQSGPLCEGQLTGDIRGAGDGWRFRMQDDGRVISCPWHGWRFDVRTGQNLQSTRYRVPTYDVEVEGGAVYVVR